MTSKISVETKTVATLLEEFKQEMSNLDGLLSRVSSQTEEMKSFWEGNASDETLSRIESYKTIFDSIRDQNKKYSDFVNSVIEKYTDIDKSEKDFVESNVTAFETDYYGRHE